METVNLILYVVLILLTLYQIAIELGRTKNFLWGTDRVLL
jgi:hypothetical protein